MSGMVKQGSLRHRVPGNADNGSEERNNHKTINKSEESKEVKIKEFSITPEFRRIGESEYQSSGVLEFRKSGETNK